MDRMDEIRGATLIRSIRLKGAAQGVDIKKRKKEKGEERWMTDKREESYSLKKGNPL